MRTVSSRIDRYTGCGHTECEVVVRSSASQEGEQPATGACFSLPQDTAVWMGTKLCKDKIEFPLTTSYGYMISPHLTEKQDIEEKRPGVYLKCPLKLRITECCFCLLRASHGVSFTPSGHPSAQHCEIIPWSVISPALEMQQGRCRFLLQRVTELQRHSELREQLTGSFIVGMSRGDEGNKEDTTNLLPCGFLYNKHSFPGLLFMSYKGTTRSCTLHLTP
jgi:hypothetical protein